MELICTLTIQALALWYLFRPRRLPDTGPVVDQAPYHPNCRCVVDDGMITVCYAGSK